MIAHIPHFLPPPTKEEKKKMRMSIRLYNADLRSDLSPQEAAKNWHSRAVQASQATMVQREGAR